MKVLRVCVLALALVACAPDTEINNSITGDDNTVNIATGGSGAGSASCAGNAASVGGLSPDGNPTQTGGSVTPDCSPPPPVIIAPVVVTNP